MTGAVLEPPGTATGPAPARATPAPGPEPAGQETA